MAGEDTSTPPEQTDKTAATGELVTTGSTSTEGGLSALLAGEDTSTPPEQTDETAATGEQDNWNRSTTGTEGTTSATPTQLPTIAALTTDEDKVKAAEEAKVVVANLEAAVKQAQTIEAATADPGAKAQIQAQVSQLQAALQGAKADAANKDAAAKSATTTPATTTGGGGGKTTTSAGGAEDKVKAAEEAKVVVANLEAAVKQAQTIEAATADPGAKAQIQAQVSQLQAALQGAKADAANKDAAAKSATTTPATTTGGGGGKTTTSAGGAEDKVKAAEEAKVVVANLEAAVKQAQTIEAATADPGAKAQIQAQVSQLQAALQGAKADAANKDAAAKSATTTPATTTGGGGGKQQHQQAEQKIR